MRSPAPSLSASGSLGAGGRALFLFRGLHDTSATVGRPAFTDVELLERLVALACTLVLIVVGELGSRLDCVEGVNEYLPARDHGLAVRLARVVDEARVTAAGLDRSVDARLAVQREQKCVVTLHVVVVVPAVSFLVADPLAGVLENARSLPDAPKREHPATVDPGVADDVQGLSPVFRHRHRFG